MGRGVARIIHREEGSLAETDRDLRLLDLWGDPGGIGVATMGVMGDMSPTTSKIGEKVTHNLESWSPT